jgi:hypothetical protein
MHPHAFVPLPPMHHNMRSALIFLLGFLLALTIAAKQPKRTSTAMYSRGANEALDTVIWVNDQHKRAVTWDVFTKEVCHHLNIQRTQPWDRMR